MFIRDRDGRRIPVMDPTGEAEARFAMLAGTDGQASPDPFATRFALRSGARGTEPRFRSATVALQYNAAPRGRPPRVSLPSAPRRVARKRPAPRAAAPALARARADHARLRIPAGGSAAPRRGAGARARDAPGPEAAPVG